MKTVSFVNMKGGVAKTTLSVNLADALNRRADKRVLLIDLDPQFNATQCIFSGEDYVKYRAAGGHTIVNIYDDTGQAKVSAVKGVQAPAVVKLEDVKPWKFVMALTLCPAISSYTD